MWFEKLTFAELLARAAERWADREALLFEGRRWSFRELEAEVNRAAKALMFAGVAPGDHVCLWLGNRPEFVFLFFAIAKVGAVLVPVNTRFRTRDMAYVLAQSDATTLIAADRAQGADYLAMIEELLPEVRNQTPGQLRTAGAPRLRRLILLGDGRCPGAWHWSDLSRRASEEIFDADLVRRAAGIDPDGLAYIMYTSGTTGFPKGVMHGHNVIRNVLDNANRFGVTPSDSILDALPLFHAFAMYRALLLSPATGARHILMSRFEAGDALRLIESERATVLIGFDTHYKDLLDHPSRAARNLRSLRFGVLPAGALATEPIARRAQALVKTMTAYGMTEIGVGTTGSYLDTDEETRVTTSGWPLPGYEMKIMSPDQGPTVPAGAVGEIYVRGYGVMRGYHNKPDETARALDADGWFRTGDAGLLRSDGCLRFLGRYKDLLKVGGENVDPNEVEKLLLTEPRIHGAAVVGVPDPRLAEIPVAFVVRAEGAALDEEETIAACQGRIASFKVPRRVFFVDTLPLTESGKVQKYRLREQALERMRGDRK